MPKLPQGRGLRRGQDSSVNQGESYAIRNSVEIFNRKFSEPDDLIMSTWTPSTTGSAVAFTAVNEWRFMFIPPLLRPFHAVEARIVVSTLDAGSTVRIGIYTIDPTNPTTLFYLPNTTALFDSSTTGLKTIAIPQVIIPADKPLFIGIVGSSTTAAVFGSGAGSRTIKVPRYTAANMNVLQTVPVSQLTINSTNDRNYQVTYLSRLGSLLL